MPIKRGSPAVGTQVLGYSFTRHKESRVKIAVQSVNRFKDKIREMTTGHYSRSISETIHVMTPVLRGWISYFA